MLELIAFQVDMILTAAFDARKFYFIICNEKQSCGNEKRSCAVRQLFEAIN